MKFTLICDESSTNDRFLVVGALTLPRKNHPLLAAEFHALKQKLKFRPEGEIKCKKVSRAYLPFYQELLAWFFNHLRANHCRFRAHIVDTASPEYRQYGGGSKEQAFYKVYYHLLFQSIRRLALEEEGSNVLVLLDYKRNQYPFRLAVLKKALNAGLKRDLNLANLVANVESRDSSGARAELLIQVVDVCAQRLPAKAGCVGGESRDGAVSGGPSRNEFRLRHGGPRAVQPVDLRCGDGDGTEATAPKEEPLPHLTPCGVPLAGRRAIRHGIRCEQRFANNMTARTADGNNRKI
ncbi:MAG: hypothetical protein RMK20_04120 [Verrucomicrobiales bacterium]|nr:hypothetical protein [Verrucomicrobiales bacterium]